MATAIEYGLIAALIAVAVIGGASQLGTSANATFTTVEAATEAEKPAIHQVVPVTPEHERIIGFDAEDSPTVMRHDDGTFSFACPPGTGPQPDETTAFVRDGRCVSFEVPAAAPT